MLYCNDGYCLLMQQYAFKFHYKRFLLGVSRQEYTWHSWERQRTKKATKSKPMKNNLWRCVDMHWRGCAANKKWPLCCKGSLWKHPGSRTEVYDGAHRGTSWVEEFPPFIYIVAFLHVHAQFIYPDLGLMFIK